MGLNQSKSKMLITMGAGLTTGMIWYFIYGSHEAKLRRQRNMKPIMGLKNVGATCFMNSVIQALAACSHFKDWIAHKDEFNRVADFPTRVPLPDTYAGFQYPLIAVVYRTILAINREIEDVDDRYTEKVPGDLIGTMRTIGYKFRTTEEQDTFEFFQFLIGALFLEVDQSVRRQQTGSLDCLLDDEDTSEVSGEIISYSEVDPPIFQSLLNPAPNAAPAPAFVDDSVSTLSSEGWSMVHDPRRSINRAFSKQKISIDTSRKATPQTPFRGMTWTTLQCLICLHRTAARLEAFDSLTIMLPYENTGELVSLMSLLENFFKPTIVMQVDCEGCSKNIGHPCKSAFSKQTYVSRLPSSLCIHILRTSWSGSMLKRSDFVKFPENLNLNDLERPYDHHSLVNEQNEMVGDVGGGGRAAERDYATKLQRFRLSQYRLVAVVSHVGDPEFGHFVTYRRATSVQTQNLEEWYYVSDEMVVPVTLAAVLNTRAYMIFYEKLYVQRSTSSMGNERYHA